MLMIRLLSKLIHFKNATLIIISLVISACGSSKDKDLADAKTAPAPPAAQDPGSFVVKSPQGTENAVASADGCSTDLKGQDTLNPKTSEKQTTYSGKVLKDCGKEGRKLTLLIKAPGEFKIGPEYGCKLNNAADYNVKCQGSGVKRADDGAFSISISGSATFESSSLHMRIIYE